MPSPALIIPTRSRCWASRYGAPEWGCRMTIMSTPIAWIVSPVLSKDSPFSVLLPLADMLITSALRIFPASSKEIRVRVLAS